MLYISYGQAKSASTFVMQLVGGIIETQTGIPAKTVREKFLPEALWGDYQDLKNVNLDEANALIPRNEVTYFKTHSPPDDKITGMVQANTIGACASFRDPRDIALSLLDAAARDRATGRNRPVFTAMHRLQDTVNVIAYQIRAFRSWLDVDNVLLIPYGLILKDPYLIANTISDQLGFRNADARLVVDRLIENKNSIIEFNKGVEGRHKTEMSNEDLSLFSNRFSDDIAAIDALNQSVMRGGAGLFSQNHRHVVAGLSAPGKASKG